MNPSSLSKEYTIDFAYCHPEDHLHQILCGPCGSSNFLYVGRSVLVTLFLDFSFYSPVSCVHLPFWLVINDYVVWILWVVETVEHSSGGIVRSVPGKSKTIGKLAPSRAKLQQRDNKLRPGRNYNNGKVSSVSRAKLQQLGSQLRPPGRNYNNGDSQLRPGWNYNNGKVSSVPGKATTTGQLAPSQLNGTIMYSMNYMLLCIPQCKQPNPYEVCFRVIQNLKFSVRV